MDRQKHGLTMFWFGALAVSCFWYGAPWAIACGLLAMLIAGVFSLVDGRGL